MKKGIACLLILGLCACSAEKSQESAQEWSTYGEEFEVKEAKDIRVIAERLEEKDSIQDTFQGEILEVCQMKGCWMTLRLENDEKIRVRFKDYGFFVPKSSAGKTVQLTGIAKKEIITVDMLQHYAEDEGKSTEEIEAIKEDQKQYTFMASGVKIAE